MLGHMRCQEPVPRAPTAWPSWGSGLWVLPALIWVCRTRFPVPCQVCLSAKGKQNQNPQRAGRWARLWAPDPGSFLGARLLEPLLRRQALGSATSRGTSTGLFPFPPPSVSLPMGW